MGWSVCLKVTLLAFRILSLCTYLQHPKGLFKNCIPCCKHKVDSRSNTCCSVGSNNSCWYHYEHLSEVTNFFKTNIHWYLGDLVGLRHWFKVERKWKKNWCKIITMKWGRAVMSAIQVIQYKKKFRNWPSYNSCL